MKEIKDKRAYALLAGLVTTTCLFSLLGFHWNQKHYQDSQMYDSTTSPVSIAMMGIHDGLVLEELNDFYAWTGGGVSIAKACESTDGPNVYAQITNDKNEVFNNMLSKDTIAQKQKIKRSRPNNFVSYLSTEELENDILSNDTLNKVTSDNNSLKSEALNKVTLDNNVLDNETLTDNTLDNNISDNNTLSSNNSGVEIINTTINEASNETSTETITDTTTEIINENIIEAADETIINESVGEASKENIDGTFGFTTATDSYFSDAVFIGDSRTVGICEYSGIDNATFLCKASLSIFDYRKQKITYNNKKTSIRDVLSTQSFGKVYLMLGINECGYATLERYYEAYKGVIEDIRSLQPDALIFIEANLLITEEKSALGGGLTNDNLNAKNRAAASLANQKDIFYIDINESSLCENQALIKDYTWDHIHIKAQYYPIWKDFLLEHAIIK